MMTSTKLDAADNSIGMRVARALASDDPRTNVTAIRTALDRFLDWRGGDAKAIPTKAELSAFLGEKRLKHGLPAAGTDFAYLQIGAARLWGTAETAHFAIVLREARVAKKAPRNDAWVRARHRIARLPDAWRVYSVTKPRSAIARSRASQPQPPNSWSFSTH